MLHFTSRQSLVQLIMTCSLINSSGDCSSCMRGGTPSRTVRVCKEEPEAMLVRTHAASNWRERVQQVVGELAANNHHTQYQYMGTEKVNKSVLYTAGHGHCTEHLRYWGVGNFRGRNFHELVKIRFSRSSRIARFCRAKGHHTPKFCGKNFRK